MIGFRAGCLGVIFALIASMSARADSVDDFVRSEMAKRHIHGLSLAVIDKGKIVKAEGYGFTDQTEKTPVTVKTRFQAGSMSQPVAALGALVLVDRKKLDLDANVNDKLRSWKVPDNEYTKTSKVTLREILSHSAGLTVPNFSGYGPDDAIPTLTQILSGEKPANNPPILADSIPGGAWRYSGGGFAVLQQLVTDATGQPFSKFMRDNVLSKIGMSDSSFDPPSKDEERDSAVGYERDGSEVKGRWRTYPELAAAGLRTTPSDLARFVMEIQRAYEGKSNKTISQETAREMLGMQKEPSGLGVILDGVGETRRFGYGGRSDGFDSNLTAYASQGQGAVVMTNANNDSPMMARIIQTIANQYGWKDFPILPVLTPIEDKNPALTGRLRGILDAITQGTPSESDFSADFWKDLSANLSRTESILKSYGALGKMDLLERVDQGEIQFSRYRAFYANKTMLIRFTLDSGGRILGLLITED
jgi:CubicO group peptidase (beta-lactamase class C family)